MLSVGPTEIIHGEDEPDVAILARAKPRSDQGPLVCPRTE